MYEQQFSMMGNRIRLCRKELSLTQIKLAELLDISSNHMSGIENWKSISLNFFDMGG